MEPRFDTMEKTANLSIRRPLFEVNADEAAKIGSPTPKLKDAPPNFVKDGPPGPHYFGIPGAHGAVRYNPKEHWQSLYVQLSQVLRSNPAREGHVHYDEAEDPAAQPMVWVSKWVDYSYKYGFGYQLSDDSVGVVFNDNTKLIILGNGKNLHYIDRERQEHYYTVQEYPATLEKKMKLLHYFLRYMAENLLKAGATVAPMPSDNLARSPCLHEWFRTSQAVVMHLTNGTLQINFQDHRKVILCPLMGAVTYIDKDKNFRTFRFSGIEKYGCSPGLAESLEFALKKVNQLLNVAKEN